MKGKFTLLLAGCSATLALGSAANAQEDGFTDAGTIQDIIVTAQRREENLQKVPVAVTAITTDQLLNARLTDISNLQYISPTINFNASSSPTQQSFGLRGISTFSNSVLTEQAVSLVIDGVVMAIQGQGIGELSDIERIELLRGPQGMLFGKNASAGVVHVVTADPRFDVIEVNASLSYARPLNETKARASANIPLAGNLAMRVSGFYRSRDGFIENTVRDEVLNNDASFGARAKILWEASPHLRFVLTGDIMETDVRCCQPTVRASPVGNALRGLLNQYGVQPSEKNVQSVANGALSNFSRNKGVSLTGDLSIGNHTLTSITAWRDYDLQYAHDIDLRPLDVLYSNQPTYSSQFTQELRLTSPSGGVLEYVAGVYYFRKSVVQDGESTIGTLNIPSPPRPAGALVSSGGLIDRRFSNTSYAAFGQGSLRLSDAFRIIAGLRYTTDDYSLSSESSAIPGILGGPPTFVFRPSSQRGTGSTDNISWKAGLQYDLSPAIMTYATVARGYKGPVPTLDSPTSIDLSRSEIPTSYEVGLKSMLFDRRLMLNIAAWDAEYKDFQAQVFDYSRVPASRISNAGSLKSRGIEVEATARVTRGFTLTGSVVHQDVYYGEFRNDGCFVGQTAAEGCLPVAPGSTNTTTDSTGNRPPNTPRWAFTAGANYTAELSPNMNIYFNSNYAWKGAHYWTSNNSPFHRMKGYGVLAASVGVGPTDGTWRMTLFARNLLDQYFVSRTVDVATSQRGDIGQFIDAEARRFVGIALDIKYGS